MKHIQIFEDFKEGLMKKPQGFFGRIAQGAKHAMGMENKEDRKALESIYFNLSRVPLDRDDFQAPSDFSFRELKPGVLLAWLMGGSILVDVNTPEISYKVWEHLPLKTVSRSVSLDLHNLKDEARALYDKLMSMKQYNLFVPGI